MQFPDPKLSKDPLSRPKFFVVCAYHPNLQGEFIPECPEVCPFHTSNDQTCKLGLNHKRKRKTGPPFPLCVYSCFIHRRGFTLYPFGYPPFGRQPLVQLSPDGQFIEPEDESLRFSSTIFDAAQDASEGKVWDRGCENSNHLVLNTQVRHLQKAALLLGLHPKQTDREREDVSLILGVEGLKLSENAQPLERKYCYQRVGQAIINILKRFRWGRDLFENLAYLGSRFSLWPVPRIWDAKTKVLRYPRFWDFGTCSSP